MTLRVSESDLSDHVNVLQVIAKCTMQLHTHVLKSTIRRVVGQCEASQESLAISCDGPSKIDRFKKSNVGRADQRKTTNLSLH